MVVKGNNADLEKFMEYLLKIIFSVGGIIDELCCKMKKRAKSVWAVEE